MVDRECAVGYSHLNAARVAELVAVDFGFHAIFHAGLHYARCLVGGEEARVAEYIHILRYAFCRDGREHFANHHIYIFSLTAGIAAGYGMSAEESDGNACRQFVA